MSYIGVATSGQVLYSTNDNNLHLFGGFNRDVQGTINNTIVSGIGGFPIESNGVNNGDTLIYQGGVWTLDAPTPAAHNLLSATHGDTSAGTPVRGDVIVSNSTPAWARVARGQAGQVLYSDGTDTLPTSLGQNTPHTSGTVSAPSVTFQGDLNTGWYNSEVNKMSATADGVKIVSYASGLVEYFGGRIVRARDCGDTTVQPSDYILSVTTAPVTILLPNAPSGTEIIIKDKLGIASISNRITISGSGNTIDGNATISISKSYGAFTLVKTGANWNIM